jgi:uncharacterized cupin superfamily protein
MASEAPLEQTDEGLKPTGEGWFVVNARDARWRKKPGRGYSLALTGSTDHEAETFFPQLGVNIAVLAPGEPLSLYHWENETEGFLVLYGEALLGIEGEERPLRQWDFVHCPPRTKHVIVGAGDAPCAILAVGTREFMGRDDWGGYSADPLADRYGIGLEEDSDDAEDAYARFGETTFTRYREGWLPEQ